MDENLLKDIRFFLISDLKDYQLCREHQEKRVNFIGRIDLSLSVTPIEGPKDSYECLLYDVSDQSKNSTKGSCGTQSLEEMPLTEETNKYARTSSPIPIKDPHRLRASSVDMDSRSWMGSSHSEAQVKHTGRLTLVSGKLPKPMSGAISYFAFLLPDRLVLFKRLRDNEPALDIAVTADSVCLPNTKSTIRFYHSTSKSKSYTFACNNSNELLTWNEVINEAITSRRYAAPTPIYADQPNWNLHAKRQSKSWKGKGGLKSIWDKRIRGKSPRETISEPLYVPTRMPSVSVSSEDASESFEGFLKLQRPSGDSVLRYCILSNGLFSVCESADRKTEAEFKFPLQCCELQPDTSSSDSNRLSFSIVQGCVVKVTCEALDQISHIKWLKYLATATQQSPGVPHHLLSSSGQPDASKQSERPSDRCRKQESDVCDECETDDYQIPISISPLTREKIPEFRSTVQSIRESFYDYGSGQCPGNNSVHHSQQELSQKNLAAEVHRSESTRPLYVHGDRQALQTKVQIRLLPDIERFINSSEDLRWSRSGSDPLLTATADNRQSAVYVEATDMNPTSLGHLRRSNRSSHSTTYSSVSAALTSDSSGLGAGSGGADDLLLDEVNYMHKHVEEDLDEEEDIYEVVEPRVEGAVASPSDTVDDSGIDQDASTSSHRGLTVTDGCSEPRPEMEALSLSEPAPETRRKIEVGGAVLRPRAKPRSKSFTSGACGRDAAEEMKQMIAERALKLARSREARMQTTSMGLARRTVVEEEEEKVLSEAKEVEKEKERRRKEEEKKEEEIEKKQEEEIEKKQKEEIEKKQEEEEERRKEGKKEEEERRKELQRRLTEEEEEDQMCLRSTEELQTEEVYDLLPEHERTVSEFEREETQEVEQRTVNGRNSQIKRHSKPLLPPKPNRLMRLAAKSDEVVKKEPHTNAATDAEASDDELGAQAAVQTVTHFEDEPIYDIPGHFGEDHMSSSSSADLSLTNSASSLRRQQIQTPICSYRSPSYDFEPSSPGLPPRPNVASYSLSANATAASAPCSLSVHKSEAGSSNSAPSSRSFLSRLSPVSLWTNMKEATAVSRRESITSLSTASGPSTLSTSSAKVPTPKLVKSARIRRSQSERVVKSSFEARIKWLPAKQRNEDPPP